MLCLCDTCEEPIDLIGQAMLEWIDGEDGTCHDFQIVHHFIYSPLNKTHNNACGFAQTLIGRRWIPLNWLVDWDKDSMVWRLSPEGDADYLNVGETLEWHEFSERLEGLVVGTNR